MMTEDLTTAVELSTWTLPGEILVEGDLLWWRGHREAKSATANQSRLLGQFVRLANGDDAAIASFARRWGVLDLCGHGYPRSHASSVAASELNGRLMPVRSCIVATAIRAEGWRSEPLERWRSLAGQAGAMLQIAQGLRLGRPVQGDVWAPLQELFTLDPVILGRDVFRPPEARTWRPVATDDLPLTGRVGGIRVKYRSSEGPALGYAVRRWLELGGVRVHFDWMGDRGKVSFGGTSLFGALATLLATGVSGSALLMCDECHLPFVPLKRRPPAGTRHFCPDCREAGAPQRHASAAYRARKRSARASID